MADTNNESPKRELAAPQKNVLALSNSTVSAILNKEWEAGGQAALDKLNTSVALVKTSSAPSEIVASLEEADQAGHQLAATYQHMATELQKAVDTHITSRERSASSEISSLSSRKSSLERENEDGVKSAAAGGAIATGGAILVDIVTTGGLLTLLTWAGGIAMGAKGIKDSSKNDDKIKDIEGDISRAYSRISALQSERSNTLTGFDKNKEIVTFVPQIIAHRVSHAKKTYNELDKYAHRHRTTSDDVIKYLQKHAPEVAVAATSMLKADYRVEDLAKVEGYARKAEITDSPEQRAFLQFVNHSIVPHVDYFEIWASKMRDLEEAQGKILEAFGANQPEKRPKLELFKEKTLSLSGKYPSKEIDAGLPANASADTKRAHETVMKQTGEAVAAMYNMQSLLADESKSLTDRHADVCQIAIGRAKEFNKFFTGIDAALQEIDQKLTGTTVQRDKMEHLHDREASLAMQVEMLHFRDPSQVHQHNSVFSFLSETARAGLAFGMTAMGIPTMGHPLEAFGRFGSQEVRHFGSRLRHDAEHAIQKKWLDSRQRHDPEELKAALNKLDAEVEKLAGDKEFLAYMSNNAALEGVRAVYMLFPRLIAGENNIESMEKRLKKAGYERIDDFVADLKSDNPRLADAMQNFLLGFANSNDLKVIVAEANAIDKPDSPKEKLLVEFVEKVIKPHYRDQARQASIVDHLEMRNVIFTGHSFHSFGEVVKRETDAALQALLSGKRDFTLTGSNDVHQIFGFYQHRHGKDYFVDMYDHNRKLPKRVQAANPVEIKVKRDEVIEARNQDTKIPRVTSLFTEICAHEYLLTQGANIAKNIDLATTPQMVGALEMVNTVTEEFIKRLALNEARARKSGELGHEVECLIAQSFVDFFSELGALHSADQEIRGNVQKVKRAYSGENFSLANDNYTTAITENAQESFGLFLQVYQRNLEKYLEVATRENRKALMDQLVEVQDIMKDVQPGAAITLPESPTAKLLAHYRNHSLGNAGHSHSTWTSRAESIHRGGKEIS